MKIYKILSLLFIMSLMVMGCESELEIDPEQSISGEQAITSEANLETILIGVYNEAFEVASYGGRIQVLSDLWGATTQVNWNGTFVQPRQYFNKDILVDNGYTAGIWINGYRTINQANIVLDNLDIVTSSVENKDRIEGEARFLRALTYFDLVRFFAQQYETGQTNSQQGLIIRTKGILDYSGSFDASRDSVEDVYQLITEDLTEAINKLPATNDVFATSRAAQALLARVYLQQGNYGAARDAANDVITTGDFSLTSTFADAFNNDVNSSEDIFAFQNNAQDSNHTLNLFYADQANGGRGQDISIEDGYLNLFDDATDSRGSFFYIGGNGGARLTSKYTNQFANITLIRLAEMYLIRAEANLIEGTSTGDTPLNDVNRLRTRAGAGTLGFVDLNAILLERQLELGFEGFLVHDLRRTESNIGTRPYNDNLSISPIPQEELNTNGDIDQNPGYGG